MSIAYDLFETKWEDQLNPDEKAVRKDGKDEIPVVLLAGLQRLARMAGLICQDVKIQTPSDTMVQAVFYSTFLRSNGREVTFVGTADCSSNNTQGKFLCYPTAVAESRAEARSLRKALGIKTLSAEEIGMREGVGSLEVSADGKISAQVVEAIRTLCESRKVDQAQVIEEVVENKERAATIFDIAELTTQEGQKAMEYLNSQKVSKPKLSAKDVRDQRKKELEAKQ